MKTVKLAARKEVIRQVRNININASYTNICIEHAWGASQPVYE